MYIHTNRVRELKIGEGLRSGNRLHENVGRSRGGSASLLVDPTGHGDDASGYSGSLQRCRRIGAVDRPSGRDVAISQRKFLRAICR